jgi:hypothetical protein
MATIEELLGKSWQELKAINDYDLASYLADITKLEPIVSSPTSGLILPEDEKPSSMTKKVKDDDDDDDCPIKKGKKKPTRSEQIKGLLDELSDLDD